MNQQTRSAAIHLLAAINQDSEALDDMPIYGDWMTHLTDQLTDSDEDN